MQPVTLEFKFEQDDGRLPPAYFAVFHFCEKRLLKCKMKKTFFLEETFSSSYFLIFQRSKVSVFFNAKNTSQLGRKSYFQEIIPFDTHSTEILPPLANLKKNQVFSEKPIYFFKKTQVLNFLRSLTISNSAILAASAILEF